MHSIHHHFGDFIPPGAADCWFLFILGHRTLTLTCILEILLLAIDSNSLETLDFDGPMPRLKILRASGNRIGVLDTSFVPNLRTLYLDNNSLTSLGKVDRLVKLENLSLRNQSGGKGW